MDQVAFGETITPRLQVFARHSWARLTGAWEGRGSRAIPTYRGASRVGNWRACRRDVLGLLSDAARTCGDLVRIPVLYNDLYLVSDPAVLREVLIDAHASYGRGVSQARLRRTLGEGMLTDELDGWIERRREAGPAFAPGRIAALPALLGRHIDAWFVRWDRHASRGETRPLANDLMALATQVSAEFFFDAQLAADHALAFVDDLVRAQELEYRRLTAPWAVGRDGDQARTRVQELAAELARAGGSPALQRQATTLLVTAPENPSNILAWALYSLARAPALAGRASAAALAGDDAYLSAVVHETLRLYPGAWSFDRTALEDRVVAGYHIPAGALIFISPFVVHRDPRRWPDPLEFRPERFLGRSPKDFPPFTFMPFGAGPRKCVGDRFALAVVMAVLRRFVARYRLELDPGERGELQPLFTLRPRTGLLARLSRR